MKAWKVTAVILSIIVIAAATATVVKFTQTFPNGGTVTIQGANGVMKMGSCSVLVDETPNPPIVSGSIQYDCGRVVAQGGGPCPGCSPAFTVSNNTVIATPTFTLSYTNHCGTCTVSLGVADIANPVQYYSVSGDLTGGSPFMFQYIASNGAGGTDGFIYAVLYDGFANGTTITLSPITWS